MAVFVKGISLESISPLKRLIFINSLYLETSLETSRVYYL